MTGSEFEKLYLGIESSIRLGPQGTQKRSITTKERLAIALSQATMTMFRILIVFMNDSVLLFDCYQHRLFVHKN
jgi:hypothetical protein